MNGEKRIEGRVFGQNEVVTSYVSDKSCGVVATGTETVSSQALAKLTAPRRIRSGIRGAIKHTRLSGLAYHYDASRHHHRSAVTSPETCALIWSKSR